MNMMQQDTGDQMESGYGNLDFGTPTDDEEVTIPPHDRIKEVPDFPDTDIRDEQTLSNTQREDWLLPTEPLHGARPLQTGRERPPVILVLYVDLCIVLMARFYNVMVFLRMD